MKSGILEAQCVHAFREGTRITRAPRRKRNGNLIPRAEHVGDLITADHQVLNEECVSRHSHRYAVIVQDCATQWLQACPCKTRTPQETEEKLQKFLEPDASPKVICIDNSLIFGKACEDQLWIHCTSTPHRPETNGGAERAARRVTILLQSGLDETWWPGSTDCYRYPKPLIGRENFS